MHADGPASSLCPVSAAPVGRRSLPAGAWFFPRLGGIRSPRGWHPRSGQSVFAARAGSFCCPPGEFLPPAQGVFAACAGGICGLGRRLPPSAREGYAACLFQVSVLVDDVPVVHPDVQVRAAVGGLSVVVHLDDELVVPLQVGARTGQQKFREAPVVDDMAFGGTCLRRLFVAGGRCFGQEFNPQMGVVAGLQPQRGEGAYQVVLVGRVVIR